MLANACTVDLEQQRPWRRSNRCQDSGTAGKHRATCHPNLTLLCPCLSHPNPDATPLRSGCGRDDRLPPRMISICYHAGRGGAGCHWPPLVGCDDTPSACKARPARPGRPAGNSARRPADKASRVGLWFRIKTCGARSVKHLRPERPARRAGLGWAGGVPVSGRRSHFYAIFKNPLGGRVSVFSRTRRRPGR